MVMRWPAFWLLSSLIPAAAGDGSCPGGTYDADDCTGLLQHSTPRSKGLKQTALAMTVSDRCKPNGRLCTSGAECCSTQCKMDGEVFSKCQGKISWGCPCAKSIHVDDAMLEGHTRDELVSLIDTNLASGTVWYNGLPGNCWHGLDPETTKCLIQNSERCKPWKNTCDLDQLGKPRASPQTQIARRCLPTFAKDQKVQLFLMENSLGTDMVAFHQGIGLQAHCDATQDSDCLEWTGDLVAGAYDFANAQLPSVDLNASKVEYNAAACQISFQIHEQIPDYWDRVYGLGSMTGDQANQLFDWASVSNEFDGQNRPDLSPIDDKDTNWFRFAGEYNIMGAESAKGLLSNQAFPYLPATTCADFAFATLRWLSQTFQMKITPIPNLDGCKGAGCNNTVLKHDRSSFVSSKPRKIGAVADKECVEFWDYLTKMYVEISQDTKDIKAELKKLLKDWLMQLNFGGLGKKACIYKNHEWYNTPLNAHIYPFDWNIADLTKPTGPMYNIDPYNCEKGSFTCKAPTECYVGGQCLEGEDFWSPKPLDITIVGGKSINSTAAIELFEAKLGAAVNRYIDTAKVTKKSYKFFPWLGLALPE